jgi:hypothetical protein
MRARRVDHRLAGCDGAGRVDGLSHCRCAASSVACFSAAALRLGERELGVVIDQRDDDVAGLDD